MTLAPDETITCQMTLPENDSVILSHIEDNARYVTTVVSPGAVKRGKKLVICGAGPSLQQYVTESPRWFADDVWACNSALPYLMERDIRVTHAVGIDQGLPMIDDWKTPYDVEYMVASSIHPQLRDHLLASGRKLRWFHNYLGINDPEGWEAPAWYKQQLTAGGFSREDYKWAKEVFLYDTLYPPTSMPQYGLNVAARALCMAVQLGYSKIRLWGADCAGRLDADPMPAYDPENPSQELMDWVVANRMPDANTPEYGPWMERLVVYADGRNARQVYSERGAIVQSPLLNGKHWFTRADMMITAEHIATIVRSDPLPGRIELMGDTLPGALLAQSPEFWKHPTHKAPALDGKGSIPGFRMTPQMQALLAAHTLDAKDGVTNG